MSRNMLLFLFVMTIWRLVIAAFFPLTNDEAYYWDWGQSLQLSYFDHPPGVSYLTYLSSFFSNGLLAVRLLSPFVYLVASICLVAATRRLCPSRPDALWLTLVVTQFIPGFSLLGVFALPDVGLLLGMSLTVLILLSKKDSPTLSWVDGASLGMALGIAGIFKYHALPLGGGIAMGFLWMRRSSLRRDISFWVAAIAIGFLFTLPVWLWNLGNDFASIRYQSDHGFGGLHFSYLYAARAWLGQIIFVTPLLFFGVIALVLRQRSAPQSWSPLLLGGFLPLFSVIEGVAPFKQTLPHWVVPAFWVATPFLVTSLGGVTKLWRANLIAAACLTILLPSVVAIPTIRSLFLDAAKGDPGPAFEVTLWPELAAEIDRQLEEFDGDCRPQVAALRWYSVAQLRFHLTGQPMVRSLDPNHRSYYSSRDIRANWPDCEVWVVTDRRHYDKNKLSRSFAIHSETKLEISNHEKLEWILVKGRAVIRPLGI